MSKFIFTLFRFLIISLILYVPLVIIWAEFDYNSFIKKNIQYELTIGEPIDSSGCINSYGHMFSRIKELKETKDIDLLFIGASQAYRGLDTRIFRSAGYRSFNLGSSNQTPLQSEVLLKRYLKKLNPKKIIYVVYPEVFSADGVESSLDIIANDRIDFDIIKLVLKQKNLKLFNTLIYAGYRDLFHLNKRFKEPIKKGEDTYIEGGYVEKVVAYYCHREFEESTWQFNKSQFHSFERSLDQIKKNNIKLVLVQAPTPKSFYSSITNNADFDSRMEKYGEYYNFNSILNLDDSLNFYDQFHLNQLGVEIFDQKLIEILH
jgi:hypothetical protein